MTHAAQTSHPSIGPGSVAVVVGAGHSGTAACRLLHALGAAVRLVERNPASVAPEFTQWAAEAGVDILGGAHTPEQFAGCDLIVPSPGVPVSVIRAIVPSARIDEAGEGPELLAETELAWRQLSGEPILGVTGTSGKTTTVTLCDAMLRAQGLNVFLGGNIGTPLSQYVLDRRSGAPRADVLVLELSSFQLQACTTLRPHVGVLTGLAPNHLDHHADMREYTEAKMRLFRCQGPDDVAVLAEGLDDLADRHALKARLEIAGLPHPPVADMQLLGPHNQRNVHTAWLACREFGVREDVARRAAAALKPIPHRLERVAERNGVMYVNDSKCTTVAALRVALEAFAQPVLLLAGGKFKGGDLESLRPLLSNTVKAVGLFGASRAIFESAWQGTVPIFYDDRLEDAVKRLAGLAHPGDVVLLAPATASYDQYTNYMARGDDFKRIASEAAL